MKKILIFTVILAVCLLPILIFGQDLPQSNKNLLHYLSGDGSLEGWFMKAFAKIDTNIDLNAAKVAMLGQAIGAIGAMGYLGYLGWQMQEGARPWEVTPMIRPILIAMILVNWSGFTSMISVPLGYLATPGEAIFTTIEQESDLKRQKLFALQNKIVEAAIKEEAQQKVNEEKSKDLSLIGQAVEYVSNTASDEWDKLMLPIKEFQIKMEFQMQKLLATGIEYIALWILRICVYLIFFIQKIWSYVLVMLGPIAIGISLIPGFENALQNWVSKFININLYTFIGYVIINIGQQLIQAGYDMQIDRLTAIAGEDGSNVNNEMLLVFIQHSGFITSIGFTVVAYVVTGVAMLMVPSIADSIVSAGGAGIMSKAKSAGSAMMGGAKSISVGKAASAIGTGGTTMAANVGVAAIKSAAAGSASGMVSGAMKSGKK